MGVFDEVLHITVHQQSWKEMWPNRDGNQSEDVREIQNCTFSHAPVKYYESHIKEAKTIWRQ